MKMNKADLVELIANKIGSSKKQTEESVNLLLSTIQKSVARGEKVTLVGFGTFARRERKPRRGRNPKTGEEINIPSKKVPAFSAGKEFKSKVNK